MIFDPASGSLTDGQVTVCFTRSESRVFGSLARRGTNVVPRDTLYSECYPNGEAEHVDQIIKVFVLRIRKHLRCSGAAVAIETVRGFGYRLSVVVKVVGPGVVMLRGEEIELLRALICRCAARPSDAVLAERLRQAAFGR